MSDLIRDFFHTDWHAMTSSDWAGLVIVLILTVLMAGLYVWVLRPSNKEKFEQYRDFVNKDRDDDARREVEHGQTR